jgi:hypothetical protein
MRLLNIDDLSEEEVLNTRVKDLNLSGPFIYRDVLKVLHSLLNQKSIKWKPHVWPSTEWFSPDGVPGFAIPFTLYHPKLIKIERKMIGFCEGEEKKDFLKLISHETGHAIDNAYRLRKRKKRQSLFGLSSTRYPLTYTPDPSSRDYVIHLEDFYGQAHPDEDWAETFSVWLTKANWKSTYKETVALEKLNYLDSVMSELVNKTTYKREKVTYQHSMNETRTVREVLEEKKKNLGLNKKNYYSKIIEANFSKETKNIKAYSYLLQNESIILKNLAKKQNHDQWSMSKSYQDIKSECKKKNYFLKYTSIQTSEMIEKIIVQHAQKYRKSGRAKVYL